jgi:hypothetical protein
MFTTFSAHWWSLATSFLGGFQLFAGITILFHIVKRNYRMEYIFSFIIIIITLINGILILIDSSAFYGVTVYGVGMDVSRMFVIIWCAAYRAKSLNTLEKQGKALRQAAAQNEKS